MRGGSPPLGRGRRLVSRLWFGRLVMSGVVSKGGPWLVVVPVAGWSVVGIEEG
jgi:hypothetical protein